MGRAPQCSEVALAQAKEMCMKEEHQERSDKVEEHVQAGDVSSGADLELRNPAWGRGDIGILTLWKRSTMMVHACGI